MFYTRKKHFQVYKDFFEEPEPFSDILPEKTHVVSDAPDDVDMNYEENDVDQNQDSDPMGMFFMNSVTATVKHTSPQKTQVKPAKPLPYLLFSESSILATQSQCTKPSLVHTPSSVHLSEFEQPPRGTSTPAAGTYLDRYRSPLRPPSYPEPVFRFIPDESFDTDASMISGDGFLLFPPSFSSPLSHKSRMSEIKEEISSIVDRMKTSVLIGDTKEADSDTNMKDGAGPDVSTDFSLPDMSGLSMVPFSEISTSSPKSIMKRPGVADCDQKRKRTKKVRINETVDVIIPVPELQPREKRPLSSQTERANRKRIKSPKLNPYAELMERCKGTKDPLNLLDT